MFRQFIPNAVVFQAICEIFSPEALAFLLNFASRGGVGARKRAAK